MQLDVSEHGTARTAQHAKPSTNRAGRGTTAKWTTSQRKPVQLSTAYTAQHHATLWVMPVIT